MATDRLDAIEAEVKHHEDPVVSASEIVDELEDDVSRRTVLDDLRLLERAGSVASKEVGARAVAWWHVERVTPAPPRSPADHPDQCALDDVDDDRDLEDELADRRVAPDVQEPSVDAIEAALEGWRPGRDIEERRERREIGRTALDWLRDQEGDVRRQDVVAALYEDHNTGQSEDAWWRRLIRDAFNHARDRGYVENPGARWRWVGDDI